MPKALVAAPGGRTFALEGSTVAEIRAALEAATGQPLGKQTLCDEQGNALSPDASLAKSGSGDRKPLLLLRVGGKGGAAPLEPAPFSSSSAAAAAGGGDGSGGGNRVLVTVKPRVQLETWSLYWKETMETRTKELPAFEALYDPAATTVSRVLEDARERLGWEPASELKRLDGFDADWDSAFVRGHRAALGLSLSAAGLAAGGELVLLRRALEEDGWRVVAEGGGDDKKKNGSGSDDDEYDSEDDWSSSEEEEDGDSSDDDGGAQGWCGL